MKGLLPAEQAEEEFSARLRSLERNILQAEDSWLLHRTSNRIVAENVKLETKLQMHALVWNTVQDSLTTTTIISLARTFDPSTQNNVGRLIEFSHDNKAIFSKERLAKRTRHAFENNPAGLAAYVADAHVPTDADFARLKRYAGYYANAWKVFKRVRDQHYAHTVHTDGAKIEKLFENTEVGRLHAILSFQRSLHSALWQMYTNGRRPYLSRKKVSFDEQFAKGLSEAGGRSYGSAGMVQMAIRLMTK